MFNFLKSVYFWGQLRNVYLHIFGLTLAIISSTYAKRQQQVVVNSPFHLEKRKELYLEKLFLHPFISPSNDVIFYAFLEFFTFSK